MTQEALLQVRAVTSAETSPPNEEAYPEDQATFKMPSPLPLKPIITLVSAQNSVQSQVPVLAPTPTS